MMPSPAGQIDPPTIYEVKIEGDDGSVSCPRVILSDQFGAADSRYLTAHNVGLIFKCSGDKNGPKPPVYGRSRGEEIRVIKFAINHEAS